MAKKRGRRKTQRRSRRSFNLLNAAELYVQTSILTNGMFNANPVQFITGRTPYLVPRGTVGVIGNAYQPSNTDSVITLPELFGVDSSKTTLVGSTGYTATIGGRSFAADPSAALATITANTKANLMPMLVQTVGTKVFFNILKKATTKQRSMINMGFKAVGVKEVKV